MATAIQPSPSQPQPQGRTSPSLQSLLEKMKNQIAIALPEHMTAERMIRVGITAVQKNPELKKCTPLSIVGAIVQASQLGLEPDGVLGQAYLVPYNNRKTGRKEAQLQIGYRGYITLARRSGEVSNIYSELVYDCDFFNILLGTNKKLEHVPNYDEPTRGEIDRNTGALIGLKGAYAVVIYKDGSTDFEYMPQRELNRLRASSKSVERSDSPWNTAPAEMYRKCPVRKLAKRLPLSPEFMRTAVHDEHVDAGVAISTTSEFLDPEEPIYQQLQDQTMAERARNTLDGIKATYRQPQEAQAGNGNPPAPQQENLDAEPADETPTVASQAQRAQEKVEQRRRVSSATSASSPRGSRQFESASEIFEDQPQPQQEQEEEEEQF